MNILQRHTNITIYTGSTVKGADQLAEAITLVKHGNQICNVIFGWENIGVEVFI